MHAHASLREGLLVDARIRSAIGALTANRAAILLHSPGGFSAGRLAFLVTQGNHVEARGRLAQWRTERSPQG
jgi:hypothetical protein